MPCAFSNHGFPSFLTQGLIHSAKPSGQRAEGLPDFAQNPVLQIQTQVSMLVQQITPCFFLKEKNVLLTSLYFKTLVHFVITKNFEWWDLVPLTKLGLLSNGQEGNKQVADPAPGDSRVFPSSTQT